MVDQTAVLTPAEVRRQHIPEAARHHGYPTPAQGRDMMRRYYWDTDNRLGRGYGKLYRHSGGERCLVEITYGPDGRANND